MTRAAHRHPHPPVTPASFLLARSRLLVVLAAVFAALAVAASVGRGQLLLIWDKPLQHAVESARTEWLDTFFLTVSRLGSTAVVLSVGTAIAILTWRRCRSVAITALVATASRPLLEFMLKAAVDRPRPNLERMVGGQGPSFPSGHTMAAVALWGLVPLVVALYTRRPKVWWVSVVVSGGLIVLIAASRIYLGVHWFSDTIGGLVVGAFFLLGVEWVLTRQHRAVADPCPCLVSTELERAAVRVEEEDERVLVGASR